MNEDIATNIKITAENIKSIVDDADFKTKDKKELILKALNIIKKNLDDIK